MHSEVIEVGGREIRLESGKIARQAHGAVMARMGKSAVLATVVAGGAKEGDFLPLTVDYREQFAAAGKIPGSFFRRETRQGEHEVLLSRIIDRSLRPLFPKAWRAETQVAATVYSADSGDDLHGLAILAACAALHISDIPFAGPLAGLRLSRRGQTFTAFPSRDAAGLADLDLIITGTRAGLVMVEGSAMVVPEAEVLEALERAHTLIEHMLDAMDRLREAVGKPKRSVPEVECAPLEGSYAEEIDAALAIQDKAERRGALGVLEARATEAGAAKAFAKLHKARARAGILEGRRIGGRAHDEIRAISCETGTLPACHGSSLFTRGETQALVTTTLGGQRDGQDIEGIFGMERRRFLLHYNFPGFSVGEPRRGGGPGRRELGHGALARRALIPVLPDKKDYPYSLRVVSTITESNGSSSMATVCGGALALAAAGVPLKAPVAGIAMGLVAEGERVAILSDILGDEDHLGDMDFKVAGTAEGITAIQLDNKLGSLSTELLGRALEQAAVGRRHILGEMAAALEASDTPAHVPRMRRVRVHPSKVGAVIGKGGSVLQGIQSRTGAKIEVSNDGQVSILGKDEGSANAAVREVQAISMELKKGGLYLGKVTSVKDFGAFVRIAEHEGLVHVSELPEQVSASQELLVRVLGADDRGRLKLSRKAAMDSSPLEALNA